MVGVWSTDRKLARNRHLGDQSAKCIQHRHTSSNATSGEFGLPTSTERAFLVNLIVEQPKFWIAPYLH